MGRLPLRRETIEQAIKLIQAQLEREKVLRATDLSPEAKEELVNRLRLLLKGQELPDVEGK